MNGDEKCVSCDNFHKLHENGHCVTNQCSCSHGTSGNCEVDGTVSCVNCVDGYHLKNFELGSECEPNVCKCESGGDSSKAAEGTDCIYHEAELCQECGIGYQRVPLSLMIPPSYGLLEEFASYLCFEN